MSESSRRSRVRVRALWSRCWPMLVFAVVIVAFAPRALAGQAVLAPVDMLEPTSPYREELGRPPHVQSVIQTDQVEGLPNTVSFFDDLRSGRVQLYTPSIAGGSATGTMPLWGLWSPFSVGYLIGPAWYAPAVRVALALFASMGFMYLFLREIKLSKYAAVLGAVAFTFTGTNLVLMNRIMAAFLLPAILWSVARALRRPTLATTATVAVFTAWLWMEGFPSGFFFGVYAAVAYTAWMVADAVVSRRRATTDPEDAVAASLAAGRLVGWVRRVAATPVGAGALVALGMAWGVALSAMTLLPFAKELTSSGALTTRVYDMTSHLPPLQVFSLVTADAGGEPLAVASWTGVNAVEGQSQVGLIVLVAAALTLIAALFGRVRVRAAETAAAWNFFGVATPALTLAVFVGTPILAVLYKVPGIAQAPISRIRYVIAFGLVVVAAIGFDALIAGVRAAGSRDVRRVSRWAAVVCLAGMGFAFVSGWPAFRELAEQTGSGDLVRDGVLIGVGLAGAALAVAALARWQPRLTGVVLAVLVVLLFIQLAQPYRRFTPSSPTGDFYPVTESHRALQRLTADGDRFRFAATEFNFYPNSSMIYDLSDIRGLTVAPTDFRSLVLAANPTAFSRDTLKLILTRDEWNLASPAYDELSLGYFALGEHELPYGTVLPTDDAWRGWTPAAEVAEVRLDPVAGEVAGMLLPLKVDGPECSQGRATVTVTDDQGTTAGAWRPSTDLVDQRIGFGIAGAGLRADSPLTVRAAYEGPGTCSVLVATVPTGAGTNGPASSQADGRRAPAVQWIVDDPSDGVRLVSTEGAWIYQRPSAQPLVSAHTEWRNVVDDAAATAAVIARRPDEPYRPVVVSADPVGIAGAPGNAQVTSSDIGDGQVDLSVRSDAPALVAYRENFSSDWVATIDGQVAPIEALNGSQLAVVVPAGEHAVSFSYQPRAFRLGFVVSTLAGVAVIAAYAWTLLAWRRRRRTPAADRAAPTGHPAAAPNQA